MTPKITWEEPFCAEGNSCFRLGTDADGNAYIAVNGNEGHYLTDSIEALRTLIRDVKAGKADHLL
ncbi:hypothetical protein MOV08_25135 [Streptomyces yunnanensis]|uniref:DUF397 domain-containing protein n=1 Tax=Streptomyces yunnanensis TaxID=156453 RepID=A0ABY8ADC1_9ACTN|nr:hypothetical protein [Streptomyces yunnanensis]WEB42209.1 hypothetical protein MOV08_25135 [Streptomyces yunnanensis]